MLKDNKIVQLGSEIVSCAVTSVSMVMMGRVMDILVPQPVKGIGKALVKVGKFGLEAGIGKAVFDASLETCESMVAIVDGIRENIKKNPQTEETEQQEVGA